MKLFILIASTAFLLSTSCSLNPTGPSGNSNPYESNNTFATATPIGTDSTVQSHTVDSADVDWISFYAQWGVTYSLQISPGTSVELYDSTGTLRLVSASAISQPWTSNSNGTCYYRVVRTAGSTITDYKVAVWASNGAKTCTNPITHRKPQHLFTRAVLPKSTE